MHKPGITRLLICSDWFYPAVKAGGPVRSVVNLVTLIAGSVSIRVLTSDRDLGDRAPFSGLEACSWIRYVGGLAAGEAGRSGLPAGLEVFHGRGCLRGVELLRVVRNWNPDVVYLNSMFSFWGTIWPLLWLRVTSASSRVIVAPRGMLKPSALAFKTARKMLFLRLFRFIGLFRNVEFHATSAAERDEIQQIIGNVVVHEISNVPRAPLSEVGQRPVHGRLRIISVGRVHRIKNTHLIFDILEKAAVSCDLFIVGPEEDSGYSDLCRKRAAELRDTVQTEFCGTLAGTELEQMVIDADLFLSPTSGENFGHSIFEAMALGTPVLISDQTIWRNPEAHRAGWEFGINEIDAFSAAIRKLNEMTPAERYSLRDGALSLAQKFVADARLLDAYTEMFSGRGKHQLSQSSRSAAEGIR